MDALRHFKQVQTIRLLHQDSLVRLRLLDGRVAAEERYTLTPNDRIRDVRQGPDGLIYLLTDEANGRIVRLEPDR